MLIRTPQLDVEQIAAWIGHATASVSTITPVESVRVISETRVPVEFDFRKPRQALKRARAKTALRTIKPLRRLRTDQAAVNESIMDALSAILAVNKSMGAEITSLAAEVAKLRAELAQTARKCDRRD